MDITIELNILFPHRNPTSDAYRRRIQQLVDEPTVEAWEAAMGIEISHRARMKLWEVVEDVDPRYLKLRRTPQSRTIRTVPDPETVVRALRRSAFILR